MAMTDISTSIVHNAVLLFSEVKQSEFGCEGNSSTGWINIYSLNSLSGLISLFKTPHFF